jgi:endoglucanase
MESRTLLSAVLNPTADADVETQSGDANFANANFGADTQLRLLGAASDTIETYLKFDISTVTSVGAARIALIGGLADLATSQNNISVFAVASTSWVEGNGVQPSGGGSLNLDDNPPGEIHWNNRPASTGVALDTQGVLVPQTYLFDVTSYVQAQKAAGATSVSFVLRSDSPSGGEVIFGSKESPDQPELQVDDDVTPPAGSVSASEACSTASWRL